MKKLLIVLVTSVALAACGGDATTETTDTTGSDAELRSKGEASDVHPPEAAIPDSMDIVDSTLVPENRQQ